jgi:pimeloyl-ACP methyl ester carboxylesterase
LVRVATWLTHLELDWASPVWRHWLDRLGESHKVVRYEERGCGLSAPGVEELSVETWVGDLERVIDAVGLERFALLGVSQGAAIAVAYAARHPGRISDLVLYGGYAPGRRLRGQGDKEERWSPRSGLAGRATSRRTATCSACCSSRTARPSRWPGITGSYG